MDYAWRGKIGVMVPAGSIGTEKEYHEIVPEGVVVLTTRMPFSGPTIENLIKLAKYTDESASLLAYANPHLIVFNCTAGSFVKGIGYDYEIIKRIESHVHIPAITTTTAIIESLKALKAKKIALAAPYPDDVTQLEKAYIEDSGYEVLTCKSLGLLRGIGTVSDEQIYSLVKDIFTENADAIFISCTGLCINRLIEDLEKEYKRPVITSNQASIWAALRKIKVTEEIEGFGQLLKIA